MGTTARATPGYIALLEAILVLPLETVLQRALECLPLWQRIILRARFGLNDGLERTPSSLATALGANVGEIEALVQESLIALAKKLEEQRPFHFLERLPETEEEFIERIRGTGQDTMLFRTACEAVLTGRTPHSRTRMGVLFTKRGIETLSLLFNNLSRFEENGRGVCREIIAEARRQETFS